METPVQFQNEQQTLRGILHAPPTPSVATRAAKKGVVFLHGWTGCRLGPHRMFVDLARRLAADGFPSLRFDFRGRGESDGAHTAASIQSMVSDAGAAARFLLDGSSAEQIVLLGICSGGKVAVASATEAPGIRQLVLWSCEPLSGLRPGGTRLRKMLTSLALYGRKALRKDAWRKILGGNVNMAKVGEALWTSERPTSSEEEWEKKALDRFSRFPGSALFVHGSADPEAAPADIRYRRYCTANGIESRHHIVRGANHSFYSIPWAREVIEVTRQWLVLDCDSQLL